MDKKKIIIIGIVLLIIILLFISKPNKKKIELENKGYSFLESKEILKLTKSEINKILKYNYNKDLIFIIESDNYNPNKLDLYLKYLNKYKNVNYLKIFSLVNNYNTDFSKMDEYIELLEDYNNVEGVINYINNYKNLNIKLDKDIINFMGQKYFIYSNLNKYLNYYNKNYLDYSEVITIINCNLNYDFYTYTKPSNLSKGMYTLVNKYNYLDANYVPDDLVSIDSNGNKLNRIAFDNFKKLEKAASSENLILKITTAYRDYNFQSILYNNYVNIDGIKNADTYSARPGYSEHQLGYSFDLTNKDYVSFSEFEFTKEFNWLKNNAHKYGFILRYPKGKENITGYMYEPWHYRYVGTAIAKYIYENDITYDEYYAYYLDS